MELISSSANYSDSGSSAAAGTDPLQETSLVQQPYFLRHLRLRDTPITIDHAVGGGPHPLFRSTGSFDDGGVLGRSSSHRLRRHFSLARWMRASSARTAVSRLPPLTRASPPPPSSRWRCPAVGSSQCRWTAPLASARPRIPPRPPSGQTFSASALGSQSPTSTWTSCSRLSSRSSWTPPRLRTGTLPNKRCWVKWLFYLVNLTCLNRK